MATNEKAPGIARKLAVAAGVVSGDPVVIGTALTGVAETTRDADGNAIVRLPNMPIYAFSVKGIDGSGNSPVAIGDKLYNTMGDTPHLSKKATGVYFGVALGAVGSGLTATIDVMLVPGA
jgi:hypothetical protein